MENIVVGIDGSNAADAALQWAAAEATAHGCRLVAIHTWSVPVSAGSAFAPGIAFDPAELETAAKDVLSSALDRVLGNARTCLTVDEVVATGSASEALLHHAKGARLLVVGTRGHGGFAILLLGSVSQQCAHHATCPLVIVPPSAVR